MVHDHPGGFAVRVVLGPLPQELLERGGVDLVDGQYDVLRAIDNFLSEVSISHCVRFVERLTLLNRRRSLFQEPQQRLDML